MTRHPLSTRYRAIDGGEQSNSLRDLLRARELLDGRGVREAFGEIPPTDRTCFARVRRVRSALEVGAPVETAALRVVLERALERIPPRAALALSGGVDSAVLCALLRHRVPAFTVEPDSPAYCEVADAVSIARHLGAEVTTVPVSSEELVRALPRAVSACETALYNLHPVARLLLAERLRDRGYEVLVTGDGADEVFGGTTGEDYLPVVGALSRAGGTKPFAPFLEPDVRSRIPSDPTKGALRALAVELGVPRHLAYGQKRPRFAPPADLSMHFDEPLVAAIAKELDRPLSLETDRERVGWTTLGILVKTLRPCAG